MNKSMRTLGMIGGTSWHSTIVYYRLINELVGKKIGTQGNPPLIIHSLNIELMREGDKKKINETYLDVAQKLEKTGAEAIIICANTPHMVYPHVAPKLEIPILHIADATGKEALKNGMKKLGLLGNKPTMTGDFIQSHLRDNYNLDVIIPDEEAIEKSHFFVSNELTQGVFSEEARSFYKTQMKWFQDKGADGIILGCTELPMLLNERDFELPMLATTQLHAQMAADFILNGQI